MPDAPASVYEPSDDLKAERDAQAQADREKAQAEQGQEPDPKPEVPVVAYKGGVNPIISFTRSQIAEMDHRTYLEHRDEILRSQRSGNIVNDLNPRRA